MPVGKHSGSVAREPCYLILETAHAHGWLLILSILYIHAQLVENRFSKTWLLFPIGHEDSLVPLSYDPPGTAGAELVRNSSLSPCMIRPVVWGGGIAGLRPDRSYRFFQRTPSLVSSTR